MVPTPRARTISTPVYADRDEDWERHTEVAERLRIAFRYIGELIKGEQDLLGSRMRNQGDFYALVGAVDRLARNDALPDARKAGAVLLAFSNATAEGANASDERARRYYEAARSAANDTRQREIRIEVLEDVLSHVE